MRKRYVNPTINCQEFVANEYCSTCGEGGITYLFDCNAGIKPYKCSSLRKTGYGIFSDYICDHDDAGSQESSGDYYPYTVYKANGTKLGGYGPCSADHEASSTDAFIPGYMIHQHTGERTEVIIWRGKDGNNVHCTTLLDQKEWERARS